MTYHQHTRLLCGVERLTYDFAERRGRLDLPAGHCTDMEGAITIFRQIHPDVERIETFAGGRPDTSYRLEAGAWTATPAARTLDRARLAAVDRDA